MVTASARRLLNHAAAAGTRTTDKEKNITAEGQLFSWWLVMVRCSRGTSVRTASSAYPRRWIGSSDTPRIRRLTRMVLPSAADGFWAAVGL